MGLQYRSETNSPFSRLILVSKKVTVLSEISDVNLKKFVHEFRWSMNSCREGPPSVHTIKMSSMNLR